METVYMNMSAVGKLYLIDFEITNALATASVTAAAAVIAIAINANTAQNSVILLLVCNETHTHTFECCHNKTESDTFI